MKMNIELLPTSSYSILAFAGLIAILCFLVALYLYKVDSTENEKCKVEFFQDAISYDDMLYSISMTIQDRICRWETSDVIIRLRGTLKDSPLILYRDTNGKKFSSHSPLNIGVALPFNLGELVEIDISCDNDTCEENEPVMSISDIYVRELPRWILPDYCEDPHTSWKKRASSAFFNTYGQEILAWVCVESVTNSAGAGIIGVPQNVSGKSHMLRAREVCLSLPLVKESEKWHDMWSDFSALDQLLVVFLDLVTGMVIISAAYAFGLEDYFGAGKINTFLRASLPDVSFTSIEKFSLYTFFSGATQVWFLQNSLNLMHIVWIACVGTLFSIPLSLLWCRLYRFIGGKGFDCCSVKQVGGAAKQIAAGGGADPKSISPALMLRTLECRSVHTGTSVSSSRRLRIEPMITNCPPDSITARSIAYVRTKMAKLRQDDFSMTGLSEPKVAKVLHESHTQSTDAPQMPPPSAGPIVGGEVVGVARYCERLVQQAPQHIRDRSVIAECYEVAADESRSDQLSSTEKPKPPCCPQECNKKSKRCRQQSFSNTTFFTEEDAASVKDLISNFSLQNVADGANYKLYSPAPKRPHPFISNAIELPQDNASEPATEVQANCLVPVPSGGILKSNKRKSNRGVETKDTGTEAKSSLTSCVQLNDAEKKPQTTVGFTSECQASDTGRRKISSPTILIGRERSDKPETGDGRKKVRYRLQDMIRHRCTYHRKSDKGGTPNRNSAPFPSGYAMAATSTHGNEKTPFPDFFPAKKKKPVPLKGPRFKLVAFLLLASVQMSELYFVTAYKDEVRNNFHIPSQQAPRSPPEPGRMHAALLSCIISVLFYLLVTVHLIAAISFMLELFVYWWFIRRIGVDTSMSYDEQYTYSVQ